MQFVGRLRTRFDRRLASDAQRAHHLHGAIASLGLGRSGACQHRSRRCFGIDGVRLPSPTTSASVWTIHLDDHDAASSEPTCQPRAVAAGAFHANLGELAILACPPHQLREAACGRGNRAGAQKSAALIECCGYVQLCMGIHPERDLLE
jgi:hypothetical protein